MWSKYQVTMEFTNKLMGGIPKNEEVIKAWINARKPSEAQFAKRLAAGEVMTPVAVLAEEVAEEVGATSDEEQRAWCGFKSDEKGLYLDGYPAKAHLKDCANVLQKLLGVKALKSKVADRVYVEEDKLYLGKAEPDGYIEHPVHIMTMQGPRSALKRNDYVEKPILRFTLRVLEDNVITQELLESLFEYGSLHGFGAERGMGYGRYNWNLTKLA